MFKRLIAAIFANFGLKILALCISLVSCATYIQIWPDRSQSSNLPSMVTGLVRGTMKMRLCRPSPDCSARAVTASVRESNNKRHLDFILFHVS